MRITKSYLILLLTLFIGQHITAQKLDHILGDIIVEVRDSRGLNDLINDLNKSKFKSTIRTKQLVSDPMNIWLVSIDPNIDNEFEFIKAVKNNRNTLLAQKNLLTNYRSTIPDDDRFDQQWQYINDGSDGGTVGADLDIDLAWDHATGGTTTKGDEIVVCIIDDGINNNHPDVQGNLWVNENEIPNNGIDDDSNGYVDDYRGWNTLANNDVLDEDAGHGTPVAGIVGAKGNNEIGVSGISWDTKMMIVVGGTSSANALKSYAYPLKMRQLYNDTNGEKGAFIVATNSSWGINNLFPEDAPLWCKFYDRMGEVGILSFAATTNTNTDVDALGDLPTTCTSPYLVSVTNIDRADQKVTSAGFGLRSIDIGAFGAKTYTLQKSGYGSFGGTSGASPHVAGTAALLYSADCGVFMDVVKNDPARAALAIRDHILHGVDNNSSLDGITTTGGRLNINNAMLNMLSKCGDCTQAYGTETENITINGATITWLDGANIGEVSLRYKELESNNWTEIENISVGQSINGLTPCTGYEYQIKTICSGSNQNSYTYSRLFETDGCCTIPESFETTLLGETVKISWSSVTAVSNFQIEYRLVNTSEWTIANLGDDTEFSFSGVKDCESYEIRIKSECQAFGNESEFSMVYIINADCGACTKEYCQFSEKNISDEWIESVVIEGVFENLSGANEGGYGNFIGRYNIELIQEEEYTLRLTPGYSATKWNDYFSVHIDYNQDGEFSSDEVAFANTTATNQSTSSSLVVPSNARTGITRMRVVFRFNEPNGPCDQSGFTFGEIEDYCVNIFPAGECASSYDAIIVDSFTTRLKLSIPEDPRVDSYIFDYRQKGADGFLSISSEESIVTINGLERCTEYEYKTSTSCNGLINSYTDFSEAKTRCSSSTIGPKRLLFTISPNPTQDFINISFDEEVSGNIQISVLSLDGKNVFESKKQASNSGIYIDLSTFESGIYFIVLQNDGKRSVEKVIKT